jgi:hypothetical protein
MRTRDRYICGQPRGGTPGTATSVGPRPGHNPKDYHKQEVVFHGGEMSYEAWAKNGKRGYSR